MKINLAPNSDQIRFYAKSALHAWDFQDLEAGRSQVVADMTALLRYLDACDGGEGVVVAGVTKIERGIRLEASRGYQKIFDLTDRYMYEDVAPHPGEPQGLPIFGDVHDMRSHGDADPPKQEVDLAPLADRDVQR